MRPDSPTQTCAAKHRQKRARRSCLHTDHPLRKQTPAEKRAHQRQSAPACSSMWGRNHGPARLRWHLKCHSWQPRAALSSLLCLLHPLINNTFTMSTKSGDSYIPRKCSATNRIIPSGDHASVQLNVGHVDANGVYTGQYSTFAISGYVRKMGESDQAMNRLSARDGLMRDLQSFPTQDKFIKSNK